MAMGRLQLIGGSYSARSIIANCQRCLNLFPEANTSDAPAPMTHYQRPGWKLGSVCPTPGPAQFLYQASNGDGYAVVAGQLYYIDPSWNWTRLGLVPGSSPGLANNPASIQDNSIQGMIANGSSQGWLWNLADRGAASFAPITDASWSGADRIDYIDTFLIWNIPGTKNFQSSLSNQIQPLDGTYIAAKTDYPDLLSTLIVNRHEILLLGAQKASEIWYDAGNPQFPFAELPGAYIEHGIAAKYSAAAADISVYWLGRDLQSGKQGMVFRQRGYETKRISNFALEYQLRQMAKTSIISDAIGSTYQQDGHVFYRLVFPTADQEWVFDESSGEWTQRSWVDGQGIHHRGRGVFDAALYGYNCALDWQTGALLIQDLDSYTDYSGATGTVGPITYLRTFPHLMSGFDSKTGQISLANGRIVQHARFQLDAECGTSPDSSPPPQFSLRWSDDRGKTWGQTVLQTAGTLGQYTTRPDWRGIGMAMDRVYEVSWSFTGQVALNGAWVEGNVTGS